jgi:hypothetical protein
MCIRDSLIKFHIFEGQGAEMVIEAQTHGFCPFFASGEINKRQNGNIKGNMIFHVGIDFIVPFIHRPDFRCNERGWRRDQTALKRQSRKKNQQTGKDLENCSHGDTSVPI